MSSEITRLLSVGKKDTTSGSVPGPVTSNAVAISTFALTTKNSTSIKQRVRELFDALRDGNYISTSVPAAFIDDVYAKINVNGNGSVVIEEGAPGALGIGDIRVGVALELRATGSGILQRLVQESFDWANENSRLVNG